MEFINNIHKYNNLNQVLFKFEKNDFIFENNDLLLKKVVENIYLSDKNQILFLLKKANEITKNDKYKEISELYNSALNLMQLIFSIKETNQINVIVFNNLLEDFELIYNKFFGIEYRNLIEKIKGISKIIQIIILNNSENLEMKNELFKLLNNIFNINKFITVQFIVNKFKYLFLCGYEIYDLCWELIYKSYKENSCHTIFILLLELRKLIIDCSEDPFLKKYLYYNIDIECIKFELQCNEKNKQNLLKSINILRNIFNLSPFSCDYDIIFQDLKKMYLILSLNNKFLDQYNVTVAFEGNTDSS